MDIIDDVYEIISCNIEEPAGRGCGYGITEEGQALLEELFGKDRIMEQEKIKKVPFRYIIVDNKNEAIVEGGTILGENVETVERDMLIDIARRKTDLDLHDVEVIVKPF